MAHRNLVILTGSGVSAESGVPTFRAADGQRAWSSQNEGMTHTTPVVATIEGVRQVIFATATGLVSLNGTSELPMRNQFSAWKTYMEAGAVATEAAAATGDSSCC